MATVRAARPADDDWFVETANGPARARFAPDNPYGVLDHEVLTPSGETVYVPLRAIADGDGCEGVFTLRRARRRRNSSGTPPRWPTTSPG